MNATALQYRQSYEQGSPRMGRPVAASVFLHVCLFAALSFGIPYFVKEPLEMEQAITVDIAELAAISQTDTLAPPENAQEKTPPAPAEAKPVYNTAEAPPDLLTPQPPDLAEEIPEPPTEMAKPEDKPAIKNPPRPKNKPKRPPPRPNTQEKPEDKPKEPEKDFTSLLKSLTPDEPQETSPAEQPEAVQAQKSPSQIADYSTALTRSEEDDLNRGVAPCWNVNAGGKYAEDLIVSLKVFVNPDLVVRDVQILDQARYAQDTHFRASADAARRALINPRCSKLHLPPEKYEKWKVFIYNFDPSHML